MKLLQTSSYKRSNFKSLVAKSVVKLNLLMLVATFKYKVLWQTIKPGCVSQNLLRSSTLAMAQLGNMQQLNLH